MVKPSLINPVYKVISQDSLVAVWLNTSTKHHSLHALQAFNSGDVILRFNAGSTQIKPSYLTIQTGTDKHITLLPAYLQYTNHCCSPNIFFDTDAMQLISLHRIQPGDELRFFYPSTEWEMAQPFVCNCGSSNCLQLINGAAHLSIETLSKYRLTEFILQQMKNIV